MRTKVNWGSTTTNTVPGPRGITTCAWCFWPNSFCCGYGRNIKKAPALTLPQARRLFEWSLPHPQAQPDYMLKIVHYYRERN